MKTETKELYDQAVKEFPPMANLDTVSQKTIDDLAWAVRIELDILLENDLREYREMDGRTKRGYKIRMQNFLEKYEEYHSAPFMPK